MDEILASLGFPNLKYDELKPWEKDTFNSMLSAMEDSTLTLEKFKGFVSSIRDGLEHELTKPNLQKEEDIYLKARLKNIMLLESFLTTPARAKQELQRMLSNVK